MKVVAGMGIASGSVHGSMSDKLNSIFMVGK